MWLLSANVFVLSVIKELNFDNYLLGQDDSNSYTFIQIIIERTPFHDFSKTSTTYKLAVKEDLFYVMHTTISIYLYIYIYLYTRIYI